MSKITVATVNAMLKKNGIEERLARGDGYFYFQSGESHKWRTTMVMVNSADCLTLDQWVEGYRDMSSTNNGVGVDHE